MLYELDDSEHSTVICAIIHYAATAADPSKAVSVLNTLSPTPVVPWSEFVVELRLALRADNGVAAMRTDDELQRRADEIARADRAQDANEVATSREP